MRGSGRGDTPPSTKTILLSLGSGFFSDDLGISLSCTAAALSGAAAPCVLCALAAQPIVCQRQRSCVKGPCDWSPELLRTTACMRCFRNNVVAQVGGGGTADPRFLRGFGGSGGGFPECPRGTQRCFHSRTAKLERQSMNKLPRRRDTARPFPVPLSVRSRCCAPSHPS
jgi:hypothetical protein